MTPSTHTRRLGTAIACAIAAAAIAVPLAQASSFVTEHSTSQNRVDLRNAYGPPDPWEYRFVTQNSASQNRLPATVAQNAAVPASPDSFDWIAAAIGAAGALTLALLTTAALLGARRTRGHVASAG